MEEGRGSIVITIAELKGLSNAEKLHPYVRIRVNHETGQVKTDFRTKPSNSPAFEHPNQVHTWLFGRSSIDLSLCHHRTLRPDKILGSGTQVPVSMVNTSASDWHNVMDKSGKVIAQVRLEVVVKWLTLTTRIGIPDRTFISIGNPSPGDAITLTGPIDEEMILYVCDAIKCPLPERIDNAWRFPVESSASRSAKILSLQIKLMDGFSLLGFRMVRGSLPHMIMMGDMETKVWETTLHMCKTEIPNSPESPQILKHLLVHQEYIKGGFYYQLTGTVDDDLLQHFATLFEAEEMHDTKHQEHLGWNLKIPKGKSIQFTNNQIKDNSSRHYNFWISVMNALLNFGFQHHTCMGPNQLFVHTGASVPASETSILILHQWDLGKPQLQLLGPISREEVESVGKILDIKPEPITDSKTQEVLGWELPINAGEKLNVFTDSLRKRAHILNSKLACLDALCSIGIELKGPHNFGDLVLGKLDENSMTGHYALCEFVFSQEKKVFQLEIQGNLEEERIAAIVTEMGFSSFERTAFDQKILHWTLNVPDVKGTTTLNEVETRRKLSIMLNMYLKSLDALSTFGFNVQTSMTYHGPLLLRGNPTHVPGTCFLYASLGIYNLKLVPTIEIQGNLDEKELFSEWYKHKLPSLQKLVGKNDQLLGW
eukprot:TRINITY_DN9832_c0_g2_i2.p1 TRINITY_DN9832_c0_g2~~TRINITY_DN9832_c0_g2_i2.p1  ORF type:complete len:653 (-),score=187.89 TRINITY_DN9832_c0_g2_i2:61-2019(-)